MIDRYMIVPCESETGLAIIWDRLEEQVIDVVAAAEAARFAAADDLWTATPHPETPEERS